MRRGVVWLALLAIGALFAGRAEAQRTGGRFGGSRGFGSSSSSSPSSSSTARSPSRSSARRGSSDRDDDFDSSGSSSSSGSSARTRDERPPPPGTARERARGPGFAEDHRAPAREPRAWTDPTWPAEREAEVADRTDDRAQETALYRRGGMGPTTHASRDQIPWWIAGGVFLLVLLGVMFWGTGRRARAADAADGVYEVRRISVAFDWRERAALQRDLKAIGAEHDPAHELETMARRTVARLADACGAARYGAFTRAVLRRPADAEARFAETTVDLRARYRVETVDGARRHAVEGLDARPEEGEGWVVVHVVVGTDRTLAPLPKTLGTQSLARALRQAVPRNGDRLVALEVIWSPSEDRDRMSSAELEPLYPELQRLDDDPTLGRVSCTYCRAVFPGELGRCPACGAPHRGAA